MSKKKSKKQTTNKNTKTTASKTNAAIEKGKKSAPKKKLHPGSK